MMEVLEARVVVMMMAMMMMVVVMVKIEERSLRNHFNRNKKGRGQSAASVRRSNIHNH
jgi:hypothetical protein